MGRMSQAYSLEQLEKALRDLGEEPNWKRLPNTQHQHKSVRFKAVVNIWTSKGTVLVQGGGAASLDKSLKETLGEAGSPGDGCDCSADASCETPAVEAVWNLFVDGSCPGNRNVREQAAAAGWGVAVGRTPEDACSSLEWTAELYGPVVTDRDSPLSLGAEVGSNNTGELSALGEAMLWLRDEAPGSKTLPAAVHYDSQYAANIATGRNRAHKNLELASTVQRLYAEIKQQRPLSLVYVKGHSGVAGNELADHLASMGAEGRYSTASKRWCQFPEAAEQAAAAVTALKNVSSGAVAKLEGAGTLSPDGSQKRLPAPATGPAELLTPSLDGSQKRLPTPATSPAELFVLSQDGSQKRMPTPATSPAELFVLSQDGSQKRMTTPVTSPAEPFTLSPDGSRKRLPTPAASLAETPSKRLRQTTLNFFRAIPIEGSSSQ